MNYELLSHLAIEDAEKFKNEAFILKKRNEILHHEIDTLKAIIKRVEEEKENLLKQLEDLKNSIENEKESTEEPVFTYYT